MTTPQSAPATRPNIVFILIDDLGWKDLACTGSHYYQTPHIDQLAADGMLFTQGYAASPICSPSRGAIYSGQYPARTKFSAVCRAHVEVDDRLEEVSKKTDGNIQYLEALHRHRLPDVPTIASMLSDAGYYTGFVGKWHCGWGEDQHPDKRGWHVAEGFRTVPSATKGHFGRDFIPFACKHLDDLNPDAYMTDVLTGRAVDFMKNAADDGRPFFLTLSHYAVHMPLSAPEDLVEKYSNLPTTDQSNPIYAAMVEKVDESVGRVVQTLRELGMEDNTMIVFTSDNGGYSPKATSNYPLLGGKSYCYEAAMRVPFIVKWPARVPFGRRDSTRVISVDLLPTWLEMAGVQPPAKSTLDGVSLLPLLTDGVRPANRPLFFHHPHYTHAAGPFSSVIYDDWKLIRFYNDTSSDVQLFDIASDPYEQDDLSTSRPEKTAEMRQMLEAWLAETDAELPRANPAFDPSAEPKLDKRATFTRALQEREEHERMWRSCSVRSRE